MYCPNCGKENEEATLFCAECGTPVQGDNNTNQNLNNISNVENVENKPKKKKWVLYIAIIAVIILLVKMCSSDDAAEYTGSDREKLPIVVNQVFMQDSFYEGYTEISFEIENVTNIDCRSADLVIMAWDSNQMPIKLCGMYDFEDEYVKYLDLETVAAGALDTYTFTFENADIKYISVFLDECEDFDDYKWKNPFVKSLEEYNGKKLEDMNIYYFEFK